MKIDKIFFQLIERISKQIIKKNPIKYQLMKSNYVINNEMKIFACDTGENYKLLSIEWLILMAC